MLRNASAWPGANSIVPAWSKEPSSAVTVWVVSSELVHVTSSPTATSSSPGVNSKPATSTAPGPPPASAALVVLSSLPPSSS